MLTTVLPEKFKLQKISDLKIDGDFYVDKRHLVYREDSLYIDNDAFVSRYKISDRVLIHLLDGKFIIKYKNLPEYIGKMYTGSYQLLYIEMEE